MTNSLDKIFNSGFYDAKWETKSGAVREITWSIVNTELFLPTGETIAVTESLDQYRNIIRDAFSIWDKELDSILFVESSSGNNADIALAATDLGEQGDWSIWDYNWNSNKHITEATIRFNSAKLNNGWLMTTAMHEIGNILGLGDIHPIESIKSVQEDPMPEKFVGNELWEDDKALLSQIYPNTGEPIDKINHLVHAFQEKWNAPAVSIAIGALGEIVYKNALGNAGSLTDDEVTTNHRFRVASVSKIFTTIAINRLIEDGELSYDSLVFGEGRILDFGDNRQVNLSQITVGHLLAHLSGLSGKVFGAEPMQDKMSYIKKILESNEYTLNFEPGTKYTYSNLGYVVLSSIVEIITSEDFEEWVKENIFLPINISGIEGASSSAKLFKQTTNDWEVEYKYGSVDNSNGISWEYCDETCLSLEHAIGTGGWIARPEDLVKLMFHLEGSLEPYILQPESTCDNFFVRPCTNKNYSAEITGYMPGTTAVVRKQGDMIGSIVVNTREGEYNENRGYYNDILPEAIELLEQISNLSSRLEPGNAYWDPFDPSLENGHSTNGQEDPLDGDNIINSVQGKGKLMGGAGADEFAFDAFDKFSKKGADEIIDFNSAEGDFLSFSKNAIPSLDLSNSLRFKSIGKKKRLKALSRKNYDFVYFENKGRLYFDGNGSDKNWGNSGEGGLVAILNGKPELTVEDITLVV